LLLSEGVPRPGLDELAAPGLRDRCQGSGKLRVLKGRHNQKLVGLPKMVESAAIPYTQFERNLFETLAGAGPSAWVFVAVLVFGCIWLVRHRRK
jgi:hypothetical protein